MNLHTPVVWVLGGVFTLLLVASIVTWLLQRGAPEGAHAELRARVRSWWVMALVFSLAMLLSRAVSLGFFTLISFLALKEYLSLIPTRRADRRVLFWAYLCIPLQYFWAGVEWYGMFVVFIPVYAFLYLPFRMVLIGETRGFLRAAGTLHWGLMTTVFCISHLAALLVLPALPESPSGGPGLVLFLVLLTQLNDVAQYLWGRRFGRRRVLPTVSPNKTWAGLLGGLGTTTILALLLHPLLTPLSPPGALSAGLLIALAGFVGDVTISALKRDLGVKDSSGLIPGHGGILDRVDSLIYTAPLLFHFFRYLYY